MSEKNERIEGRIEGEFYFARFDENMQHWIVYRKGERVSGGVDSRNDCDDAAIDVKRRDIEARHWINHTQSQQSEVPRDLREFIGDAIDIALEIEGATFSEVRRIANDCIDAEIEAQASRDADARAEE